MCLGLWSTLGETSLAGTPQAGVIMGMIIALLVLAFGWISRRFERQCDVTAAWLCDDEPDNEGRISPEGSALFAHSLERVGQLNGIPPRQRNWRHGSIAWRVSYILWLGSRGGRRSEINGVVKRIKLALWLLAAAGVVFHAWPIAARFLAN